MRRIAIVHDWLTTYAGAERVLEQILLAYPHAQLFSVCDFLPDSERTFLSGKQPHTSFIQRLPGARKHYRSYLPLMPLAIEQFNLSEFDIVISSSHAVAKGVLTGPNQLHISYVHSPIRYAWDLQHQYLHESDLSTGLKGLLAKWFLHKIRLWDARTANGVDHFAANSDFIRRRIWKTYRRNSTVIYPPVDVHRFCLNESKDNYYLTASRMVPYKRAPLIAEAFSKMPDKHLKIVGDGPDRKRVEAIAKNHANIELLGYQDDEALVSYMGRAKAFIFAAEEDFGITPVEAQACGTPVIAFGKGGVLETIQGLESMKPTGCFFPAQSTASIIEAVRQFERQETKISPADCRANAERFAPARFRESLTTLVERQWQAFPQTLRG